MQVMKNRVFIIFLVLISLGVSCKKDWLDKKPEIAVVIPETLQDCQALLDNNAIMLTGVGLNEVSSDSYYVTEANASLYLTNYLKNAYTWTNKENYTNIVDWDQIYTCIYYTNLILETLEKLPQTNEWNNVKGQALFQRGRCFFELAQVFAKPYMEATAETDLGIPLKLESDINLKSKRSTVKQTYSQIESDLIQAKNLLPLVPFNKARASKPAAYGLMARIYLSMEKYSNALVNADSCIKLYPTLLNYSDLSPTANRPFIRFNSETIFYSVMQSHGLLFGPRFNIPQALFESYSNDDLRKSLFFIYNTTTGLVSFKGFYTGTNAQLGGITSDEQYLIRAECYARAGNTDLALKDVNDLLKTRWKKNITFPLITASSPDDALAKILTERRKELLFRGLRWSDLRRLNRDPRFAITLSRTLQGQSYTLEPNSNRYTLPIPVEVIQATGMQQNEGW